MLVEDVRLAENIAEACQLVQSYQGKHLVDHQLDVRAGAANELVRHFMCAEKGRHAAQWSGLLCFAHHAQNLHLCFHGEPVAGFRFDGGGASAQEPERVFLRGGEKVAFGSIAGAADGGANAPALAGYLLIGDAGTAHFKFIGAIAGEDEVGMRIHEAGSYDSSSGVDDLRVVVEHGPRSRCECRLLRFGRRGSAWLRLE